MKRLMAYLLVIFSLFGNSLAEASSCNDPSLPVKLSELQFLDVPFVTLLSEIRRSAKCDVVKINGWKDGQTVNQNQGTRVCNDKFGRTYAINPGNPQYGKPNLGHLLDNKLGYFFCMPGAKKEAMCKEMERRLSSSMSVRWDPKTASGDGDCLCKRKGDSADAYVSCPADPTPMQTNQSTGCDDPAAVKKEASGICVCKSDGETAWKQGVTCPEIANPNPNPDPDPSTNTATATNLINEDLEICLSDIKKAKEACSENGRAAIAKCSKNSPEVNKNISKAQDVMQMGLDGIIARNANTGALEACTKMGAAGTTMIEALSFLKENCSKELDQCKKGCAAVKEISEKTDEQHIEDCKARFLTEEKPFTKPHQDQLLVLMGSQKDLADNAEKFCSGDVQVANQNLKGFIEELALNVQKADICKCQLTSASIRSGQTKLDDCDAINTPLTCIQNINQPGCSFSSVGCSPGSQIPGCRNPISAINPNGSGVGMPASGFAGPGFGAGGSGSGGAGSGKPGIDVGDVDFSDGTRPSGSGTATADAGSPFGSAAGSGSGSSGGPGGGSAEGGAVAEGEEKEKSSLSGFFQNTKSSIASLFGGGTDNKNSAAKKPDNKTYKNDVNGFRPKATVRGMANANEFGSKNRDIWKTMNERYNDQYHTFITVESPSK